MILRRVSYSVNVVYRKHFKNLLNSTRGCLGGENVSTSASVYKYKSKLSTFTTSATASWSKVVLGIETSCDDTGAAVVNDSGDILGEALHSQVKTHVEYGGIVPVTARSLHEEHIDRIVNEALQNAQKTLEDLDAIAVTVKPGLALSLAVGLNYAKQLVRMSGKPLIPIHHMEAHALTARMIDRINFPFLVLLASGGHCLLAIANDVDDFDLIGHGMDVAPGDALDKMARRLCLIKVDKCQGLSGGASVEVIAKGGNPTSFTFPHKSPMGGSCNFYFGSIRTAGNTMIEKEEKKFGLKEGDVLPNVSDICASLQYTIARQLARAVQRALLFCELKGRLSAEPTLVVSGGVASNMYIRQVLQQTCDDHSCRLVCPPPKLCTDNGIMIAWNGMEKLLQNRGFAEDPESLEYQPKCPLGRDLTQEVIQSAIKLPRLKLNILP